MERVRRLCCVGIIFLAAAASSARAFSPKTPSFVAPTTTTSYSSRLLVKQHNQDDQLPRKPTFAKLMDRFDTLKSAGLVNENDPNSRPLMMRGIGFKRIFFWLFVGFMYKWYRARFINKIPVWDRQPQWNMVVTNREQEKELKAYTCKNCGSTLFIARNRNWFFEGDTGLGGLGCFTCGAKGKDNFVMDRDRILEDVGEDDDYFDYERPLDFVTAAERRALLKKTKGDEDAANQMLLDQSSESSSPPEGAVDAVIEEEKKEGAEEGSEETPEGVVDAEIETKGDEVKTDGEKEVDGEKKDADKPVTEISAVDETSSEAKEVETAPKKKKKKKKKSKKASGEAPKKKKEDQPDAEPIDLDVLGLDDF